MSKNKSWSTATWTDDKSIKGAEMRPNIGDVCRDHFPNSRPYNEADDPNKQFHYRITSDDELLIRDTTVVQLTSYDVKLNFKDVYIEDDNLVVVTGGDGEPSAAFPDTRYVVPLEIAKKLIKTVVGL